MKLKYYKYMRIYEGFRIKQGRGEGREEKKERREEEKSGGEDSDREA